MFPNGFIIKVKTGLYFIIIRELSEQEIANIRNMRPIVNIRNYIDFRDWKATKGVDEIVSLQDKPDFKYPEPYYRESRNMWEAYPRIEGERINIGTFKTKEETERAIKQKFVDILFGQ